VTKILQCILEKSVGLMSNLFKYVRRGYDDDIFVVTTLYFPVRNKEIL